LDIVFYLPYFVDVDAELQFESGFWLREFI